MADLGHRHAASPVGKSVVVGWVSFHFSMMLASVSKPMSSRESWGKLRDGRDVEKRRTLELTSHHLC